MIETLQTGSPKVIGLRLYGKLHDEDYRTMEPAVEATMAAEGKVRLFAQFDKDFHGWDLHAAWDDFRFGMRHYRDFDRIAMVGDRRWEEWMATFVQAVYQGRGPVFRRIRDRRSLELDRGRRRYAGGIIRKRGRTDPLVTSPKCPEFGAAYVVGVFAGVFRRLDRVVVERTWAG